MSNEIKEILDKLEKVKDSVGTFIGIDNKGARILLDYMTNLQQENDDKDWKIDFLGKKLDDLTDNWISRGKKIEDLKQENERLKERLNRYNKYTCLRSKIMLDDYKSKCEKAIELLKQDKQSASFNSAESLAISILQGGKDE